MPMVVHLLPSGVVRSHDIRADRQATHHHGPRESTGSPALVLAIDDRRGTFEHRRRRGRTGDLERDGTDSNCYRSLGVGRRNKRTDRNRLVGGIAERREMISRTRAEQTPVRLELIEPRCAAARPRRHEDRSPHLPVIGEGPLRDGNLDREHRHDTGEHGSGMNLPTPCPKSHVWTTPQTGVEVKPPRVAPRRGYGTSNGTDGTASMPPVVASRSSTDAPEATAS